MWNVKYAFVSLHFFEFIRLIFTFLARQNIFIHIPVRKVQVIYKHMQFHDTV